MSNTLCIRSNIREYELFKHLLLDIFEYRVYAKRKEERPFTQTEQDDRRVLAVVCGVSLV